MILLIELVVASNSNEPQKKSTLFVQLMLWKYVAEKRRPIKVGKILSILLLGSIRIQNFLNDIFLLHPFLHKFDLFLTIKTVWSKCTIL